MLMEHDLFGKPVSAFPDHALKHRLALARFALALPRLAAEKQRLTDDGRNHRDLERLCDQERRLRPLSGQEPFRVSSDEDHRHFKRAEELVHRIEPRTAVSELN